MRSTRVRLRLVALLVAAGLAAACSGPAADTPAPTPGAAEPAKAPAPSHAPAGTVVDLAPQPEGLVYDAQTDILAVAVREPDRLLLLQGATGALLLTVPLPGHARHLELGAPGGPVLVPAEDSNSLLTVSLPDGLPSITAVGTYPHAAAQTASGLILVCNERGGTLSLLDNGAIVHTFTDKQPGGIVAIGDQVAVVDVGAFTLTVYDTIKQTEVASVPAGSGPTHMVADRRGELIVADTRGNRLLFFSVSPLHLLRTYALAGTPYGLAYDEQRDTVWVTLTATDEVVGLDVSGATPVEVGRFPTVRQPNTVAVDQTTGRVWVAGRTTGELQTIDP